PLGQPSCRWATATTPSPPVCWARHRGTECSSTLRWLGEGIMDVQHRAHASEARKSATPWRGDVGTPDDHVIVLFGATGDLARRKLLPGLFRLGKAGLMPARYRIIGSGRSQLTDDEFRRHAKEAVNDF